MKLQTILLCGVALAGCNQTTSRIGTGRVIEMPLPPIGEAPSTSGISNQAAFAAARSTVLSHLKDPDSAKFGSFTRKTVGFGQGASDLREMMIKMDKQTDLVCGTVNAKNGFGGYSGMETFSYRIAYKDFYFDSKLCSDPPLGANH